MNELLLSVTVLESGVNIGKLEADGDIGMVDELIFGGMLFTLFIPGGATYLDLRKLIPPPAFPPEGGPPSPILNIGGGVIPELLFKSYVVGEFRLEFGSRNNPGVFMFDASGIPLTDE